MSRPTSTVLLGPSLSLLLADAVLVIHVGIAAFVVAGLLLVIAGNLSHWGWVNNAWFRVAHLAAIGIVVAESSAWIKAGTGVGSRGGRYFHQPGSGASRPINASVSRRARYIRNKRV